MAEAKAKLRSRSRHVGEALGASAARPSATALVAEARRRPWRTAAVVVAVGVVIAVSPPARRMLFGVARRALTRGG